MARVTTSIIALLASFSAIAQESGESSTDESNQAAYYVKLIEIGFDIFLQLGNIASYALLGLIAWSYLSALLNPNKVAQQNRTVVTLPKLIGGMVVCSMLYAPLQAIASLNDLTGLVNESEGRSLCLVVDVDTDLTGWQNQAERCLEQIKSNVSDLASYNSEDSIEFARLDVWGGLIQLMSLGFFLSAGAQIWMKLYGIREVKMTYFACIIAMVFSSAGMAIFNITDYIQDLRTNSESVLE